MVFEKVAKLISEQLGVEEDKISMDSSIAEDLGADSLDVVELLIAAEEEFGVNVPDEEAMNFKVVGDVVNYIEKKL